MNLWPPARQADALPAELIVHADKAHFITDSACLSILKPAINDHVFMNAVILRAAADISAAGFTRPIRT